MKVKNMIMRITFIYFLFFVFPFFIFSQEMKENIDGSLSISINKPIYYVDSEGNHIDKDSYQDSLNTKKYIVSIKEDASGTKFKLEIKHADLSLLVGKELPAIELTDMNQNKIYLEDKGITLLSFWDVTCPPCIEELTVFDILAKEYPEVNFIAITSNSLQNVKQFMQRKVLEWDNLFIVTDYRESQLDLFKIRSFPFNIIIDNTRIIKSVFAGKRIREILKTLENIREVKQLSIR